MKYKIILYALFLAMFIVGVLIGAKVIGRPLTYPIMFILGMSCSYCIMEGEWE